MEKKCVKVPGALAPARFFLSSFGMAVAQKYFSFAEIVQGRDASVRVSHDGLLSAVDLVKVVTGFYNNHFLVFLV